MTTNLEKDIAELCSHILRIAIRLGPLLPETSKKIQELGYKIEYEQKPKAPLGSEVGEKVRGYIFAAFGLVVGLAWNEAIKAAIEYLFPLSKNTLFAKFFYAIVLTLFIVYAMRVMEHKDEK